MKNLPKEIKLSDHAKQRLEERKSDIIYDTENILNTPVKWYTRDDLIYSSALYKHSCYTTRQSKDVEYLTDGNIEVIYDKNTYICITILEVKDKFKPITQHTKPEVREEKEKKNET